MVGAMVMSVRAAATEAELDAWRRLHQAVLPDEPVSSVAELASNVRPDRRLYLAELDSEIAGGGLADRSGLVGHGTVWAGVLEDARRGGVGSTLLAAAVAHVRELGIDSLVGHVDGRDDGSRAFAERFGFVESDRQVEQVLRVRPAVEPEFPPELTVLTVAERPELLRTAFDLAVEAFEDMAHHTPASTTLEEWLEEEATLPGGSFVALAGDQVVGYSGLMRDRDNPARAEDGLTAVRRAWRGRGIARALKQAELAWAAENGLREIVTWTQRGNEAMRRLNDQLGYEYRAVSVTMTAPRATVEARLA
jgi:GNAT superfamily N-acetyltransferase